MTIIADSGSTKTTWMEVESGNKVVTEGLNPHFTSDEQFLAACQQVRNNFQLTSFDFPLFFYGAGCGNASQRERVERSCRRDSVLQRCMSRPTCWVPAAPYAETRLVSLAS